MADFVESEVLPGLIISATEFWSSFAKVVSELTPENKVLLLEGDQV